MRPQLHVRPGTQLGHPRQQFPRVERLDLRPVGTDRRHHRTRLVRVRRAGDVGDQTARSRRVDSSNQQLALQRGEPGHVLGLATPANLRPPPQSAEPAARRPLHLTGLALNDGIALGHVVLHEPRVVITNFIADDVGKELKHLESAVETMRSALMR